MTEFLKVLRAAFADHKEYLRHKRIAEDATLWKYALTLEYCRLKGIKTPDLAAKIKSEQVSLALGSGGISVYEGDTELTPGAKS